MESPDRFPRFDFGFNTPEDRECGMFGFWLDNYRTWTFQAYFIIKPTCWSWGFGRDEYLPNHWWLGLGPIALICGGPT